MSKVELELVDFLYLRENVDDLDRALKPDPKRDVIFPLLRGEKVQEGEAVEIDKVLKTTLAAVDSAARELRNKEISLARDPIEVKLTGSLVGVSPNADRILVKIKPEK